MENNVLMTTYRTRERSRPADGFCAVVCYETWFLLATTLDVATSECTFHLGA